MNRNLEVALTRASELLIELEREYKACLTTRTVSPRAEQLTHEVAERLRSALDRTARCYWEQKISPSLSSDDRDKASVYFPVSETQQAFDSTMGRWRWASVKAQHTAVSEFLKMHQPYFHPERKWLSTLNDLAIAGKHIDLVPQKMMVDRRITVASAGGGSVTWGSGVTFGSGVSVMGAPIDPRTQRIVPTAGVTERVEEWVSFIIGEHNVNALGFCTEAVTKTRHIMNEMCSNFELA